MIRCCLLALIIVSLAACSSVKAGSNHDRDLNFADYRSYALVSAPIDQEVQVTPSEGAIAAIEAALAAHMQAAGLSAASAEEAQLWISYKVSTEQRMGDTSAVPGQRPGWQVPDSWKQEYATQYERGTLVFDIYDPGLQRVVWQGWAAADIFERTSSTQLVSEVAAAALASFPPGR